ncbi:hypothetical protein PAXRUDRAFT_20873 [Paxillus rubicundulus Ve08.2h10]|uniref:Uncharacterized protein n=1 Tax=Paxillus rubicundulus Ve08.2h10 TaxID=930991 RepID=A0A0D0BPG1_9AGAM|nr:hypothetical protein PAXRUDRAFT_20873 [Paxillus rubicundulus Ve08.2h10]
MPRSLFTEEQLTLLEGVLDEYCEISGQGKVTRKEAIVTWVTRKFVTVHHENDIEATKKLQNSVKNWLNNRSWELTDEEEYFQKTNWFTVAPGSPGYVQYWQKAASALSKTLSDGKRQTYVDLAVEWDTKGVPKDVQMKQVRSHFTSFLRQALTKIEIFRGMHDHNDPLDDGPAVKKNTFNATKQVLSLTAADPKQKFELRKAKDGHWDLPPDDFLSASLELQKRLVRDFMNCCWQEMAGWKGSAPFSKMMKDIAEFVDLDAGYLPDKPSLKIKDPSHMSKDNMESILRHWKERQEN